MVKIRLSLAPEYLLSPCWFAYPYPHLHNSSLPHSALNHLNWIASTLISIFHHVLPTSPLHQPYLSTPYLSQLCAGPKPTGVQGIPGLCIPPLVPTILLNLGVRLYSTQDIALRSLHTPTIQTRHPWLRCLPGPFLTCDCPNTCPWTPCSWLHSPWEQWMYLTLGSSPCKKPSSILTLCVCVCVCVCECVCMCTGTQLCLTRCDPRDYSPSGSSVHGIFQARILEWVAIPFRRSSQPRDWTHISYVSCIGRWILYQCTTWEAPDCCCYCKVTSVVSDSVRPHPWDSPGKNTGVGCHFLLQCIKVKSESEVAQSSLTLRHPMDCSLPGSSVHGIFQARVLEWGAIAFSEAPDYQLPNATGDLGCPHICPSSLLLCSG